MRPGGGGPPTKQGFPLFFWINSNSKALPNFSCTLLLSWSYNLTTKNLKICIMDFSIYHKLIILNSFKGYINIFFEYFHVSEDYKCSFHNKIARRTIGAKGYYFLNTFVTSWLQAGYNKLATTCNKLGDVFLNKYMFLQS